jgi:hypothetical protein
LNLALGRLLIAPLSTGLSRQIADTESIQGPGEKRHLLRWWIDSSGTPAEELRAQRPLACFGDRLRDPAGGWPYAQTPYSIVLDTSKDKDPSLVAYL